MNKKLLMAAALGSSLVLGSAVLPSQLALAQGAEEIEEVVVTGSRIRRNPLDEPVAIMDITAGDIEKTGLTNLGDALRQLPLTGSAINSQFNVPGNSGFPQDGSGIGAGAVQVAVRNLQAKRTLVLVDGRRWIAGASASGVPGAVDLNTIPDNVIERVEVLQDGASAIYGSDAIGGVVNIITQPRLRGLQASDAQTGGFLSEGDGQSSELVSGLWGGGNDTTHLRLKRELHGRARHRYRRSQTVRAFPNPGADELRCRPAHVLLERSRPRDAVIFGPNFRTAAPASRSERRRC